MKLANLNMLFLEDQEDLAVTIIPLFKVFVQKVFYAKNIIEATKLLENEKIDLIFSDVALKNECGLDPETNSYSDENVAVSMKTGSHNLPIIGTNAPATRNYLFGINLTF